jgi:hypothetical protein
MQMLVHCHVTFIEASCAVTQVTTLMWMRTTMNFQYRYGTSTTQGSGFNKPYITINVPVVYMAPYVMVVRRARSITGGIGRGGTKKVSIFRALVMDIVRLKIITSHAIKTTGTGH